MIFDTKNGIKKMLDTAPGPSPWYLRTFAPKIKGYAWIEANDEGAFLLKKGDDVVLILNMYNYVKYFDENYLLIWSQAYTQDILSPPVNLKVYDIRELKALHGNIDDLLDSMKQKKQSIQCNTPILHELNLSTLDVEEDITFHFPPILKQIDELLILCHSSGVAHKTECGNNIGLMVVEPQKDSLKIYPQDWFNYSNCDFGYQWITRVGRNKMTGEIIGDGIRISPFLLDKTLKNVKKVFS